MAIQIIVTVEIEQQEYEGGVENCKILSETARSSTTGKFSQFPSEFINKTINTTAQNACISAMKKVKVMRGDDE